MTPPDQLANDKRHALFVRTIAACMVLLTLMSVTSLVVWRVFTKASARTGSGPVHWREDLSELNNARRAAERGDFETALQHADSAAAILLQTRGSSSDWDRTSRSDGIASLMLQAELLFRLHRTDEMLEPLETVLQLDPDHFEAHVNLAFALRFCGMLDEADRHVQWCLERQSEFLPALRIQAEILRDRGDFQSALQAVRKLLVAAPHDLDCHILQAELLMYRREFELAYQNLRPLDNPFRQNHRFAAMMAQLCRVTGRLEEARDYNQLLKFLAAPDR